MATPSPTKTSSDDRSLVAPIWHTIVFVFAVLALALLQGRQQPKLATLQLQSRLPLYGTMIAFELILFAYVWLLGLRPTGTKLRDVIGGRWENVGDIARDIGVALVFWFIVAGVLLALEHILGENATGLRAVKLLLPQTPAEMAAWIVLSTTAGFCEEVVFRGYLQRQFLAITGRVELAVLFQALAFGVGHLYQGEKGVITISVYGAMFGILAVARNSLRPGMIQHAGQDIFSGIAGSLLARRHLF